MLMAVLRIRDNFDPDPPLTEPDLDPAPAIFVSDLQNDNGKLNFFLITF